LRDDASRERLSADDPSDVTGLRYCINSASLRLFGIRGLWLPTAIFSATEKEELRCQPSWIVPSSPAVASGACRI
jgi:hypothetical protein